MTIRINSMGEVELIEPDGQSTYLSGTCDIGELAEQLGREPTPSDFDEFFHRQARRAITSDLDWLLYCRYVDVARAGFREGDSSFGVYANNLDGFPHVYLVRSIWLPAGEPVPTPGHPWRVDEVGGDHEDFDEYELSLEVTTMDSGRIFREAYQLQEWWNDLDTEVAARAAARG